MLANTGAEYNIRTILIPHIQFRLNHDNAYNTTAKLALALISAILLLLTCEPIQATDRAAGIDAVLVMDSSGSMRQNDPTQLRIPAAKLFVSLLGEEDRVAVMSFSDLGYPIIGLTPVNSENNKAKIFSAINKVSSKGAFTNIHDALLKSQRQLHDPTSTDQRKRYIILMSDGKMDLGNSQKDAELVQSISTDLIPGLMQNAIQVYSIAFTEASDTELLRTISQETSGLFTLAKTDQELHDVFTTIFESTKTPDMLPMEGGEFLADSSIEEINIVAAKQNDGAEIALEAPDKTRYTHETSATGIKWFRSQRFDMITLSKPQEGAWRLLSTDAERNKAYVITDLSLGSNIDNRDLPIKSELSIQAWLNRSEERLIQKDVLANTVFILEVKQPNGVTSKYSLYDKGVLGDDMADDGIYSTLVEFHKEGSHQLSLVTKSKTFQRKTVRYFEVSPEASVPESALPPEPELEPAPEPETKPEPEPEMSTPDTAVTATQDEKESINIWIALAVFVLFNLVIISIIAIVVVLKKKDKDADMDIAADHDSEETPSEGNAQ